MAGAWTAGCTSGRLQKRSKLRDRFDTWQPRVDGASRSINLQTWKKRNGRSERIRTSDPLVPNEVRYQAALHSDTEYELGKPGSSGTAGQALAVWSVM